MSIFLTAEWRKLIMAQYAVDPAILQPFLPPGTEVDLFQGQCIVSLVGFLFDRVRIKGILIPGYTRFEEVNLRFYVCRSEANGTPKRGVVFIREFVPRAAVTFIASTFYQEPYATVPMRHRIERRAGLLNVEYKWNDRGSWSSMSVEAALEPQSIVSGSMEEFITEHYWGYTKRSHNVTSQYEVEHPHWVTYPIHSHAINADFRALYGVAFASINSKQPDHILLAEGSAISVGSGTRLRTG